MWFLVQKHVLAGSASINAVQLEFQLYYDNSTISFFFPEKPAIIIVAPVILIGLRISIFSFAILCFDLQFFITLNMGTILYCIVIFLDPLGYSVGLSANDSRVPAQGILLSLEMDDQRTHSL